VGDLIIIAAFGMVPDAQTELHTPRLVFVDGANRQTELRQRVAVQASEAR
jgi:aspartate 1-decarboxylase